MHIIIPISKLTEQIIRKQQQLQLIDEISDYITATSRDSVTFGNHGPW